MGTVFTISSPPLLKKKGFAARVKIGNLTGKPNKKKKNPFVKGERPFIFGRQGLYWKKIRSYKWG